MISSHFIGVLLALSASVFFGGADFSGGIAARRNTAFQTMVIASLISVALLAVFALVLGESIPPLESIFWACLAGVSGALGLVALFKGLASGKAAIVSPASGVVSAAMPVVAAALTQGMPNTYQLLGFATALVGIWLVTRSSGAAQDETRNGIALGLLAGFFFGLFFITLARIEPGSVFFPLTISKSAAFLVVTIILIMTRTPMPSIFKNKPAILSGLLDPLANALYLLSTHYTRLDIAAVLSSLYPAVTVFLSLWFFKEIISRLQWVGVGLCLVAIALIIL
ncbi:MAG: DMT family transporter [Anaerolineaceae bacterium]|nr:DMT family transporter [Anaerolineaceae bacterium]